jgi:hypothetical protein
MKESMRIRIRELKTMFKGINIRLVVGRAPAHFAILLLSNGNVVGVVVRIRI